MENYRGIQYFQKENNVLNFFLQLMSLIPKLLMKVDFIAVDYDIKILTLTRMTSLLVMRWHTKVE